MATYGATYSVTLPAVDDAIGSGYTAIRFYRAASEHDAYVLVGTATLGGGTTLYEYEDAGATRQSWWQWALYGVGPGESERSDPQPVAYLSYSRRQIRQAAGQRLGMLLTVTASGGTTTTVVSSSLVDPDASPSQWANGWVYGLSGSNAGVVRRIRAGSTGYNVSTGTLTLASALPAAPASGDQFEVWSAAPSRRSSPELMNDAINLSAPFMWVTDIAYLESDALEIDLPTLAHPDGVLAVEVQAGADWVPLPRYEVMVRMGVGILRLPYAVGKPMRIIYNRHMDQLGSDDDSWEVPLRWAAAEVAFRYLESLIVPMGNKELISDITTGMQVLRLEANQYRRIYGARRGGREVPLWM